MKGRRRNRRSSFGSTQAQMKSLTDKLIAEIRDRGPLRFSEVMEAALFDAEFGYYTKGARIGRRGADFLTASELHPLFARTVAAFTASLLAELGANTICEIGAGTGALAREMIESLLQSGDEFARTMRYFISERSVEMERRQRQRLEGLSGIVKWVPLAEIAPFSGVVVAVEVFDAMPVHRVMRRGATLCEEHAGESDGVLQSVWLECSDDEIKRHLETLPIPSIDGQIVEVNFGAASLLREIAAKLTSGYALVFDYGDVTERLFTPRRLEGTLRRFSGHAVRGDYLEGLGESDITASVDFGSLQRHAELAGFTVVEFEEQARWLLKHGIVDVATRLDRSAREMPEKIRVREALKELTLPGRMSDNFKVLLLQKKSGHS